MKPPTADLALIVAAAIAASSAIVLWHDQPLLITAACAAILVLLLRRFHETSDLVGLAIGASVGNAIELVCDAAGVWVHADRTVLGLAPAYIMLCYPILGLAIPRMIDALAGDAVPQRDSSVSAPPAAALLTALVIASSRYGADPVAQSMVCAIALAVSLWQFHSRRDLMTASAGMLIALVWELPATLSGAWWFPAPQVFGLLPAWLPAAYAVFFVTMRRLTEAAIAFQVRGFA